MSSVFTTAAEMFVCVIFTSFFNQLTKKSILCFRSVKLWQLENTLNKAIVTRGMDVHDKCMTAHTDISWRNKGWNNCKPLLSDVLQQYILSSIQKSLCSAKNVPIIHLLHLKRSPFKFSQIPWSLWMCAALIGHTRKDPQRALCGHVHHSDPENHCTVAGQHAGELHARCPLTQNRLFTDCERIENINELLLDRSHSGEVSSSFIHATTRSAWTSEPAASEKLRFPSALNCTDSLVFPLQINPRPLVPHRLF